MTYDEFIRRVHSARVALATERVDPAGYTIRIHPEDWDTVQMTAPWWERGTANVDTALGLPVVQDDALSPGQIILRREVAA